MTAKLRTLSAGVVVTAAALLPSVAGTAHATAAPVSPRAVCNDFSTVAIFGNRIHLPSIGYQTHAVDCTLRQGNSGPGVFVLQGALRECYKRDIEQDADYGPITEAAVEYVQKKHGLTADGIYGPDTRKAMKFPRYNAKGTLLGC